MSEANIVSIYKDLSKKLEYWENTLYNMNEIHSIEVVNECKHNIDKYKKEKELWVNKYSQYLI
jgi:hypothetical protein